jgi:NAD(P)-dependent dehydrogenase (short-subunit alcohol dehydrogenase family)
MNAAPIWLVTGAARGLGRAIVEHVLAQGGRAIAAGRSLEALAALGTHERLFTVAMDVNDRASVNAGVARAVAHVGGLDVLVNNAGYGHFGPAESLTDEELQAQLEANLFGVMRVCQAAIPTLRSRGGGRIFQLSSIAGLAASVGGAAYSASKFALEGFTEALAQELAPSKILCTIVEPGGFRTEFAASTSAKFSQGDSPVLATVKQRLGGFSGKQVGDPKELARVLWQVSTLADPPSRLLIGADALGRGRSKLEFMLGEVKEFEALSRTRELEGGASLGLAPSIKRPWSA